jgi:hypothetical protein
VRLGIVSGRRRQGKTFPLDAIVQAMGGFFYTATDSTEGEALAGFGQALVDFTGGGRHAFSIPARISSSPSRPCLLATH